MPKPASAAKLRANRIHNRLKTLCHNWMVKHMTEKVDQLRERARKEIARRETEAGR
jgi:hypothetical protein